jgi:dethiobiotin synthetase
MTNSIAILGIHTGIGKTIASAVIAEAIDADYWKPVQAGIEERDTTLVREQTYYRSQCRHMQPQLLMA